MSRLFDLSGYRVFLAAVKGFAAAFPDRTFQCPLVHRMMENGRTGMDDILFLVNEACRVIEEGVVVRATDLDIASVHGMKFPSERGGIMYWADSIGAEYIYARLKCWSESYGNFFKPSQFLEERATNGIPLAQL